MSTLMEPSPNTADVREEWTQAVNRLVEQITKWTRDKDWKIKQQPRQITEEGIGAYSVPDLSIETPEGRLIVEVKARGEVDAAGRVELAAWPTLYRVLLLHRMGQSDWTILTDSGIPIREPWNKKTFLTLVSDLIAAQ